MSSARACALAAAVTVVLAAASSAQATATLVSPAPGAVVADSHPEFTWTVPGSEESDGISISTGPQTTPEGKFYEENVVDSDVFFENETDWAPDNALPAGHYWWLVWTHDLNSFAAFYTPPRDFTIPVSLRITRIGVRRYTNLNSLTITVYWTSNADENTVGLRLRRGGRTIYGKREAETFNSIGATSQTTFYWDAPRRLREGTPLRIDATLAALGELVTASRPVRSP
jgi:hypothetical protein